MNVKSMQTTGGTLTMCCFAAFLMLLAPAAASPQSAVSSPSPDPRLQKAYRFRESGWTYVHLEGSPAHIGFQHGYLLAREIADAFEAIKLEDTHTTKRDWEFFRKSAREMLWPKIDAEYQQEHVAGAPRLASPGNCSAFIATGSYTRDHQIVIAHNNWTSYLIGSRWVIVFDIVPERGNRILMDGFPGVITSDDDFGVNSAGIMITETTITQFEGWDPEGK